MVLQRNVVIKVMLSVWGLLVMPLDAQAQSVDVLRLPYSVKSSYSEPTLNDSYELPLSGWSNQGLKTQRFEGQVERRAFQIDAPEASLLDMIEPLRNTLQAQGYEIVLDCEARSCGGFDFRFAIEVLAEPAMHVDMAQYRFVSARKGDNAVGILVSKSRHLGFVQIISALNDAGLQLETVSALSKSVIAQSDLSPAVPPEHMVATALARPLPHAPLSDGLAFALDDLTFASSAAELVAGEYGSLAEVANWLKTDPKRRVVLVGHTDLSGDLGANLHLSKKRAEAVRRYLSLKYAVPMTQLEAKGVGPLSPRADNKTPQGRQANRRVEALAIMSEAS